MMDDNRRKDEIRISVRKYVEFLLRSGDIDHRFQRNMDDAMAEGSRIHRNIQRRMGADYEAEVFLRYIYDTNFYRINIEGRADGIFRQKEEEKDIVVIDEIKATYRELKKITNPKPEHLAQVRCYAYMYAVREKIKNLKIRLTYCNIETEELKYFYYEVDIKELEKWFQELLQQYIKWADYIWNWSQRRRKSIERLNFPFPYRDGQKKLVTYVYQTIYHKKKLFIEAPTGVGKTISTIFPSIQAMGKGMCEKIFYLTAKTITRTVAEDAIELLRDNGLQFKSVILTAKEKICFMEEAECNPIACPYAKGHYDRINDAVYDLLVHEDSLTREKIEEYARKHQVCPFEFCLDLSLFADAIIGDYNYLFDPHVYLKRFFSEGSQDNYVFLVDEAHNLLERGRKMYSAELRKEDFLSLKRKIKENKNLSIRLNRFAISMEKNLEKCNKELLILKRSCENYRVIEIIDPFIHALSRLQGVIDEYLDEQDDNDVRKEILKFFFEISHFLMIHDLKDDNYVTYAEMTEERDLLLKLFCVNPSENLRKCMMRGRSTILFSATLLPIQYYKKLLGGIEEDYEVYAQSTFQSERKLLIIANDVTSKYTRRGENEYNNIACYLNEVVRRKRGNYLAFFPSFEFLKKVYQQYILNYKEEGVECVLQGEYMKEEEREEFLFRFIGNEEIDIGKHIHMKIEEEEERGLLGFCVLGGVFSEGIDLKEDSLIGAIIIGTGLPQVSNEKEILKDYYNDVGENGFDYAYRYPGINKVLQAAGRVIRTKEDVGVIALLDYRFLQSENQKLFPREWMDYKITNRFQISKKLDDFWNGWI